MLLYILSASPRWLLKCVYEHSSKPISPFLFSDITYSTNRHASSSAILGRFPVLPRIGVSASKHVPKNSLSNINSLPKIYVVSVSASTNPKRVPFFTFIVSLHVFIIGTSKTSPFFKSIQETSTTVHRSFSYPTRTNAVASILVDKPTATAKPTKGSKDISSKVLK